MRSLYKSGKTFSEVGAEFGVSWQVARKLIRREPVEPNTVLRRQLKACAREPARVQRLNVKEQAKHDKCMSVYGCGHEDVVASGASKALKRAYLMQKRRAGDRGIGWQLGFIEWLSVWESSGRLSERGRGREKFCMSRLGDCGPYSASNVEIKTCSENSLEGIQGVHARLRAQGKRLAPVNTGKGRGWTFIKRHKRNPYQVMVGRQYVGCFPTQDVAEAAYRAASDAVLKSVDHA